MTAVKLNKIEPQTVEVWNADGLFGIVNEYEFNDIRIQIKETKETGWFAVFEEIVIVINTDGRCDVWPDGFFDTFDKQLDKLVQL